LVPITNIDNGEPEPLLKDMIMHLLFPVAHIHDPTSGAGSAPITGQEAFDARLNGGVDQRYLQCNIVRGDGTDDYVNAL
jgi:hypothetical protein